MFPTTMCHMSCVKCQVSHVRCQVSGVKCHNIYIYMFFCVFFLQSSGAFQWRVYYQRGLPRLVFLHIPFISRLIDKYLFPFFTLSFTSFISPVLLNFLCIFIILPFYVTCISPLILPVFPISRPL